MDYDTDQFSNYFMPVFSWDYEDIEKHELWYRMAEAYISCCLHLLFSMAEESLERDFFRAKACVSLFEHSIELFLKFALYVATKELNITHNLQRLYAEYCALYSEDRFKFDVDINSVVHQNNAYPYNTFAKYPVDKEGNLWPGNQHIEVITWLKNVEIALNDFLRLKPLIIEKYNNIGQ